MYLKSFLLLVFVTGFCRGQDRDIEMKNFDPVDVERPRVLRMAEKYYNSAPVTVTNSICKRSAGGAHDFYSEGDYWWPDPKNPDGPYIRKDGLTNPHNFTADRKAMIRLNQIVGSLTSAYIITGDVKYLQEIIPHIKAWFVNENTKMNPNLRYAQAIKGVTTGRGIGIIDTVHLIEVAKAIEYLEAADMLTNKDLLTVKTWFKTYLSWITTSSFGKAERDNGNNHSVTWAEQVAAFAHLLNDQEQLVFCRKYYKTVLLPEQMNTAGAFPKELARTKPYGYSIFVLDAMTTLCQILSTPEDNLFDYTTPDGKNIGLGLNFLYPYLKNKSSWPYAQDVLHWEDWPVQQPCLLFGGLAFEEKKYLELWKSLPSNYTNEEVIRNMPVKYCLLWLNK